MAFAPRRNRRRPYGALLLLTVLIAGLSWVLYLRLTNQPMRDPFGFYQPAPEIPKAAVTNGQLPVLPPAAGKVRALISTQNIPAYNKVTRDDLFNARQGLFAYMDLDESFADDNGILVDVSQILGRVMKRTKRPGFAFTESDFLPKGTRPGMAGGIPPGKRALRIDVDLVRGIIGLNPGDRFDVVAAWTIEPRASPAAAAVGGEAPAFVGVYSEMASRPRKTASASAPPAQATASVDVLVQAGVVVSGLETRLVPTASTSLTAGQISGTRPVQEMVIALAPEEVAPLLAALRLDSDLTCLARSGRPEDPAESLTPGLPAGRSANLLGSPSAGHGSTGTNAGEDSAEDSDPVDGDPVNGVPSWMPAGYEKSELAVIETILGGQRTLTAVPKASSSAGGR